ncbi:unnamed protein product [Meganyctiphanes norvegica]|uniref:Nudix hydrolase domain-containing protein n=1 Tax=Meganyctiphanes norvegica TaxID=48144 RepID=A0AAV2QLX2_MEGNR
MENVSYFKGFPDRFSGITVSSSEEYLTITNFEDTLQASLQRWNELKMRAIWFNVDLNHSEWVPILAKNGFTYHRAQSDEVTMVRWLPKDEPNNIPRYAHNMVGVGAFVVNEEGELLVVQERFYKHPHWKLPGGYVEPDEDIQDAAIREVKEETGVDTDFQSVISFRHVHGANFGCSDFYFIVHLRPKSKEITMCKNELSACQWMKIQDYIDSPFVHQTNRFFANAYLEGNKRGVHIKATDIYQDYLKKYQKVYSVHFDSDDKSDSGVNGKL